MLTQPVQPDLRAKYECGPPIVENTDFREKHLGYGPKLRRPATKKFEDSKMKDSDRVQEDKAMNCESCHRDAMKIRTVKKKENDELSLCVKN